LLTDTPVSHPVIEYDKHNNPVYGMSTSHTINKEEFPTSIQEGQAVGVKYYERID